MLCPKDLARVCVNSCLGSLHALTGHAIFVFAILSLKKGSVVEVSKWVVEPETHTLRLLIVGDSHTPEVPATRDSKPTCARLTQGTGFAPFDSGGEAPRSCCLFFSSVSPPPR